MIGVFPQLDGISFALFHVEQPQGDFSVRVRWRMADPDLSPAYRSWQTVNLKDRIHLVQPPRALSAVEVEWWDDSAGKYGDWRQAALLRLTRGSARFSVRAGAAPLALPNGFTAVAPVPRAGIASFVFPALHLAAGAGCEVVARQEGLCLANLLLSPGVFVPRDPAMEIENIAPVTGGWEELPPGPVVVSRVANPPANYFAFAGERVAVAPPEPVTL